MESSWRVIATTRYGCSNSDGKLPHPADLRPTREHQSCLVAGWKYIIYAQINRGTGADLLVLPVEAHSHPLVLAQTTGNADHGQFSPDTIAGESTGGTRERQARHPYEWPAAMRCRPLSLLRALHWQRLGVSLGSAPCTQGTAERYSYIAVSWRSVIFRNDGQRITRSFVPSNGNGVQLAVGAPTQSG